MLLHTKKRQSWNFLKIQFNNELSGISHTISRKAGPRRYDFYDNWSKIVNFFMCYCETDAPFVGQNKVYCQNKMQIILNSNPVLSLECA